MAMEKTPRRTFMQFVNLLKEHFPCSHPIIVRRTTTPYCDLHVEPRKRIYGDCTFDDEKNIFIIRINKDDELENQKDTLMHEWAHCLAPWFGEDGEELLHHSDEWALAYGKIYRKMVDELDV